ncbi:hypothetical protein KR038_009983 [Drosophila bunnanda]|nr:hypothetical protein KR038_009983 [Drosophila bunnanda]
MSESAPKRAKGPHGKPRVTNLVSQAKNFIAVASDSLAMALVDDHHNDGRLLLEKWEQIVAKLSDMVTDSYVMTTSPTKNTDSLKASVAIENIRAMIIENEGEFKVIMAPKLVTAIDEADLARRLERAEAENAQVSGDEMNTAHPSLVVE